MALLVYTTCLLIVLFLGISAESSNQLSSDENDDLQNEYPLDLNDIIKRGVAGARDSSRLIRLLRDDGADLNSDLAISQGERFRRKGKKCKDKNKNKGTKSKSKS